MRLDYTICCTCTIPSIGRAFAGFGLPWARFWFTQDIREIKDIEWHLKTELLEVALRLNFAYCVFIV